MTQHEILNKDTLKLDESLQDYLIDILDTTNWYSYYTPEYKLKRYIYKLTTKTKEIIISEYKNIFPSNKKMEDICFFKDKNLLVGTVSHEFICDIFFNDDYVLSEMFEIGNWKKSDHQTNGKFYEDRLLNNFFKINEF